MVREEPKQAFWLWGPAGCGKSTEAYKDEQIYDKSLNKWWDGYQGEENVVMDDVDETHACLLSHFKRWADPLFNHPGEIKGGQVVLNYKKLTVTSNHSIDEIWPDVKHSGPLHRRFQSRHFDKLENTMVGFRGSGKGLSGEKIPKF